MISSLRTGFLRGGRCYTPMYLFCEANHFIFGHNVLHGKLKNINDQLWYPFTNNSWAGRFIIKMLVFLCFTKEMLSMPLHSSPLQNKGKPTFFMVNLPDHEIFVNGYHNWSFIYFNYWWSTLWPNMKWYGSQNKYMSV